MYCWNCGKKVADGSKYCPYCGAELIRNQNQNNQNHVSHQQLNRVNPNPPVKKKKRGFLATTTGKVVLAAAIAVCAVGGGYAAYRYQNRDNLKDTAFEKKRKNDLATQPKNQAIKNMVWIKKPGTLGEDFLDFYGLVGESWILDTAPLQCIDMKENLGYGTDWAGEQWDEYSDSWKYYDENAIRVTLNNPDNDDCEASDAIYDYSGSPITDDTIGEIDWDEEYMNFYYTISSNEYSTEYAFDTDFGQTGEELKNFDYMDTYMTTYAIYNGSLVNCSEDGEPAYNGLDEEIHGKNVILPVINEDIFSYDEINGSEIDDCVEGFVLYTSDGEIVDLPSDLTPLYWPYFEMKFIDDLGVSGQIAQESFVNGVIQLKDDSNKFYLWNIDTHDFIGSKKGYDGVTYYEEGYIGVKHNDKWGIMDMDGNMVIGFIFDDVSPIYDGKAYVTYDGYAGILDLKSTMEKAGLTY